MSAHRKRRDRERYSTPENQGYAFGHGKRHLSTVLAHPTMLAFPIDRTRQRCCDVFRRARARAKRPKYLWEYVRGAFPMAAAPDWETLYALATKDGVVAVAIDDASQPDRRLPTVRRGGFFGDDWSRTGRRTSRRG